MDENINYTPTPGAAPTPTPEAAPVTPPIYNAAPTTGPAYAAPGATPAYSAPGAGSMYAAPVPAPKKSPLVPLLILAAVVVVAICAAVFFITRNSATSVAKRCITACYEDDKLATSLWAFDLYDYYLIDYDGDVEAFFADESNAYDADITSWNEYHKAIDIYFKEYWEDTYGKYTLSVDVIRSKDISVRKALEENSGTVSYLEENLDFDTDKISDAKVVTLKVKIDGEDDTSRRKCEVYMVKMGLVWRVLAWSYLDD